ncbi:hypothetical protein HDU97_002074 [Phlyctochytrium planicorne]|nr:hypothetical protein HDU97_002074 [Phlyctochytrium planicorne]
MSGAESGRGGFGSTGNPWKEYWQKLAALFRRDGRSTGTVGGMGSGLTGRSNAPSAGSSLAGGSRRAASHSSNQWYQRVPNHENDPFIGDYGDDDDVDEFLAAEEAAQNVGNKGRFQIPSHLRPDERSRREEEEAYHQARVPVVTSDALMSLEEEGREPCEPHGISTQPLSTAPISVLNAADDSQLSSFPAISIRPKSHSKISAPASLSSAAANIPSISPPRPALNTSGMPDSTSRRTRPFIAQKRSEIAAKMAAIKDRPKLGIPSAAPTATSPSSIASFRIASKAAPSSSSASTSRHESSTSNDLQKRISEVKNRIQNMSGSGTGSSSSSSSSSNRNAATAPPPRTSEKKKGGLKMEVHPLFEMATKVSDVEEIRTFIPKANFATAKANQRAPDKAAISAAAALAAKAIEKANKAKELEAASALSSEPAEEVKKELKIVEPPTTLLDPTKNPYFDPKIGAKRGRVAGKAFKFVQKGKYVDQANKLRQAALLEKLKADIAATVKKAGMDVELDLVSDLSVRREPPPNVEWWDAPIVGSEGSYDEFDLTNVAEGFITNLIQHPIPIQPSAELGAPPAKPLMLTKKERKKLRRQKRQEAQKEKQDKIRLGLLPPEQPKLKISNLMRVLGTDAVQDPTKIEAMVRAQMKQRVQKQEKYIAENKLTKEQRRERKRLKLLENTHVFLEVAVFKVVDLSKPTHRFKVEVNANQLNLTGTVIIYPGMSVVIVEGGTRGLKQYKKLMLRRIKWDEATNDDDGEEDDDSNSTKKDGDGKPNECNLVWEGKIKRRLFQGFKIRHCMNEKEVKEILEKIGAMQYWDAAKHYVKPTI